MTASSKSSTHSASELDAVSAALRDIGVGLTSKLSLAEVNHAIMEHLTRHFKPGVWALLIFDEQRKKLRFELIAGENTQQLQGALCHVDAGLVGEVFRTGETAELTKVEGRTIFEGDESLSLDNVIAVPLARGGRRLGVIALCNLASDPTPGERMLLGALGDFAAIALENARQLQRVRELSVTDDVTSLYNARYLEQALEQEYSRSKRAGTPISVIFIDLDYFKQVNDRHGHLVGSEVLRETANILRQNLRATDIATRYGGDEYVLILPDTAQDEALLVAGRCLEAIRKHIFGTRQGIECKITASFGVATIPDDTSDKLDLVRLADQAMYYVKEHNRDNIATAGQLKQG